MIDAAGKQFHAAAITDCQALSVTPMDYRIFHSIAPDIGGGISKVTLCHFLDNQPQSQLEASYAYYD